MKKSRNKLLLSNVLYFFFSMIAVKMVGYFLLPIYTSNLTDMEYGLSDNVLSAVNLIYPIIALGLSGAVLRYSMDEKDDISLNITAGFIGLMITTMLSVGSIPIVRLFQNYKPYAWFIPACALCINFGVLFQTISKATNQTKLLLEANVLNGIILLFCGWLFVTYFRFGEWGPLLAYGIANAFSMLWLGIRIKIKKYLKKHTFNEIRSCLKKLLKYGVPLVPNSLAWWMTQVSDRYLVTYWFGEAVTGLYAAAYKLPSIVNNGVNVFIQAWQLTAISEFKKKDSYQYYSVMYRYFSAFGFLLTSTLIVSNTIVSGLLLRGDFFEAKKYVPLLMVAAVAGSHESFFSTFYLADNKTGRYFLFSILGSMINLGLNILLIPLYSAWGATIATVICYCVVYILRGMDATKRKYLDTHMSKNIFCLLIVLLQALIYNINGMNAVIRITALCGGWVLIVLSFRIEAISFMSNGMRLLKRKKT